MGPNTGGFAGSHYDSSQLEALGANLALALLDYSDPALLAKAATELMARQQAPKRAPLNRSQEAGISSSSSSSVAGTEVRTVSSCYPWAACEVLRAQAFLCLNSIVFSLFLFFKRHAVFSTSVCIPPLSPHPWTLCVSATICEVQTATLNVKDQSIVHKSS